MDGKRVKYQILGHEYVLQNQIAQAAEFVLWAKGLIDVAVKASPAASMAWAGVCIILPVLTNPSTADKANRDGFTYVTTRMRYYTKLEPLLLSTSAENSIVARKEHIIDLYKQHPRISAPKRPAVLPLLIQKLWARFISIQEVGRHAECH